MQAFGVARALVILTARVLFIPLKPTEGLNGAPAVQIFSATAQTFAQQRRCGSAANPVRISLL
jgi:hypothetical protein